MDEICCKALRRGLRANGAAGWRRLARESRRCQRTLFSTTQLQAAKPKKKQPIKNHKASLEYKPRPPPPPPRSVHTPPRERVNPFKNRTIPLVVCSIAVLGLSGFCTYFYVQYARDPPTSVPTEPGAQADVSSRYDAIARTFDFEMDSTEAWMGLPKMRRRLISQAHGDILEVSIGTGRNLEYYDWDFKGHNGVGKIDKEGKGLKRGKVRSFTAVDKSGEMLEIAHEKFSTMFPGIVGVRWIIGDASKDIPAPPGNSNGKIGNLEGKKYDTVIQTMGLCSAADPVALLKNLGEHVKEEDGRILLLEHGRGRWDWLNNYLDKLAEGRAQKYGCWWNRNIDQIIEDSGLSIVKVETPFWHGGTTWWIELKKPRQKIEPQVEEKKVVGKEVEAVIEKKEAAKKIWWW